MSARLNERSSLAARSILGVGTLVFLHAAYSTYESVSLQKALGLTASGIPNDITIETFAGLAIVLLGTVLTASPLRSITWASEYRMRTIDQIDARPSFLTFNHRGPHLFAETS